MTADLPKLNVPCGKRIRSNEKEGTVYCGDMDFQGTLNDVPRKRLYCKDCDYQLFVVKAHAAAHHEKAKWRDGNYERYASARDAVLKLTGLKLEDLEKRNGGDE